MIEVVLFAAILAKMKKFKFRYLFREWSFYPVLLTQSVLIYLQATVFLGNYYFIQYASFIKSAAILCFIFAILRYQLYKPALLGSGSILLGSLLNRFVISQNNGKMPVFPSFSYFTGYVKPDTFQSVHDIHILGNAAVNWKFLTDFIDLGYSILSPGDVLIHLFSFLMLYALIREVNYKFNPQYKANKTRRILCQTFPSA